MAHNSTPLVRDTWNDTGLDGPTSFWVPGGTFLISTGATPPTSHDDARKVDANDVNGETVEYGGTDRVWIKPLAGANRFVQET